MVVFFCACSPRYRLQVMTLFIERIKIIFLSRATLSNLVVYCKLKSVVVCIKGKV